MCGVVLFVFVWIREQQHTTLFFWAKAQVNAFTPPVFFCQKCKKPRKSGQKPGFET